MRRLVVIGACYIDTIMSVPHYPDEDSKLRASNLVRRRGGNSANTLEVLGQLLLADPESSDISTTFCGVFPKRTSADARLIESSFNRLIDVKAICREERDHAAFSYIIKSDASSSRTIVSYGELEEMSVEEFFGVAEHFASEAVWYHFEGRIPKTTAECIRYLRTHWPEVQVSVEVEKPGREGLEELARLANVVFYSGSWAQSRGYTVSRAADFFLEQKTWMLDSAVLYCTWGSFGASMLGSTGDFHSLEAFTQPNKKVIDTVGAGDVFIAGILWSSLCRKSMSDPQKLAFANELAGRKVLQEGFGRLGDVISEDFSSLDFSAMDSTAIGFI